MNEIYLLRSVLSNTENDHHLHPNILSLLSIKYLNSSIYLIYDYATNRDLATHGLLYGGTEKQLTHEQIRMFLYQLISAIGFCHDRLVYHCAIELKHLLITRTGQLKLSNFEYAKHGACPSMRIDSTEVCCHQDSGSSPINHFLFSFHVSVKLHQKYFSVIEHFILH